MEHQTGRNFWVIKKAPLSISALLLPSGIQLHSYERVNTWCDEIHLRECSCLGSSCFLCWRLCCSDSLSAKSAIVKTAAAPSLQDFQSDWKHFVLHTSRSKTTMWVAFSFIRFQLVTKKQKNKQSLAKKDINKIGWDGKEEELTLTLHSVHQSSGFSFSRSIRSLQIMMHHF